MVSGRAELLALGKKMLITMGANCFYLKILVAGFLKTLMLSKD